MFLQKALRTSLALLLVCGLASFSGAIAATARSETAQEKRSAPMRLTHWPEWWVCGQRRSW
jgi:hypothetical protein